MHEQGSNQGALRLLAAALGCQLTDSAVRKWQLQPHHRTAGRTPDGRGRNLWLAKRCQSVVQPQLRLFVDIARGGCPKSKCNQQCRARRHPTCRRHHHRGIQPTPKDPLFVRPPFRNPRGQKHRQWCHMERPDFHLRCRLQRRERLLGTMFPRTSIGRNPLLLCRRKHLHIIG